MTDPFENVVGAVADVGERLVEYAEVWRKAIDRNAAGTYAADDFLVDLQSVWGMSVRDAARVGAAFVDGLAPLLADDAFGPGPKRHDADEHGDHEPGNSKGGESAPSGDPER
jgi:hypothetical protein